MMDKRSSGMKRGKDNQRIGRYFVNFLHRVGERTIAGPRRSYFRQTKQRERVAPREL